MPTRSTLDVARVIVASEQALGGRAHGVAAMPVRQRKSPGTHTR